METTTTTTPQVDTQPAASPNRLNEVPKVNGEGPKPQPPPPEAEPWFNLCEKPHTDEELIKNRFLCRGGGMLLVGQTGIGKSSFIRQMLLHFAIGRPFLGIVPTKPLKSLIIQAENDDQDEAEMCQGVVLGSGFTREEVEQARLQILHCREQVRTGVNFFVQVVEPLIQQHKPDLLVIDPVLAYLGGDQNDQKTVGPWLRNWLHPILQKYECAVILVHHTAKVNQKSLKENWAKGDLGYLGAGSAEFANWNRASMCVLRTELPGCYELHAPKRGERLGWRNKKTKERCKDKIIQHSAREGNICWEEGNDDVVTSIEQAKMTKRRPPTTEQFLTLFPVLEDGKEPRKCLLSATQIRDMFGPAGWKRDSYADVCADALSSGAVRMVQDGHGNRRKLYGRPDVVEAYSKSRPGCPSNTA